MIVFTYDQVGLGFKFTFFQFYKINNFVLTQVIAVSNLNNSTLKRLSVKKEEKMKKGKNTLLY